MIYTMTIIILWLQKQSNMLFKVYMIICMGHGVHGVISVEAASGWIFRSISEHVRRDQSRNTSWVLDRGGRKR